MFGHMENPIPRPPSCLFIVVYTKTKTTSGCFVHDDDVGASVVERARETPAREGGGGEDGAAREGIVVPFVHRSFGRSVGRSLARSLGRSLGRRVESAARRASTSRDPSQVRGARERGRETDASEARVIERVHRNDAFDDAVGDDVARARGGGDGDERATSGDARRRRRRRRTPSAEDSAGTGDDVGRARTRRRR